MKSTTGKKFGKGKNLQCRSFLQAVGCILISLCAAASAATAQDWALPALTDEIATQFSAIGRLVQPDFPAKQGCTATLIAPDLIVTAAHCASASGRSRRVFVAGWLSGGLITERASSHEMRHPAYALDGRHNPRNDIALIVLDSPINDVAPIPIGNIESGSLNGTEVALVGYHRRSPDILSGDFNCPVAQFKLGLLEIGCPVINGNSGSPLLVRTELGDWQVVGVVSSQHGAAAIAVELPDWLRREIATHLQR